MMSRNANRRSLSVVLAAAIAGPAMLLLGASAAQAQYQVRQDGSANDANNRLGSNGRNYGGAGAYGGGSTVTGNQVIYGNVNRGMAFRGPVGTTDARAFRGNTATITSDRFIRDSSGSYDRANLSDAFVTRAYYGDSRAVAAPAGYRPPVSIAGNAYSQAPKFNNQPLNAASLSTLETGEGLMPRLGTTTTIIGGSADLQSGRNGSYIMMSPLTGIRSMTPEQVNNYVIQGSDVAPGPANSGDRFRTGSQFIDRVRSEMGDPNGPGSPAPTPGAPNNGQGSPNTPIPGGPQPLNKPLATPENPINTPVNNQPSSGTVAPQPLTSGVNSGEGTRRSYAIPTKPNVVMTELERRLREAQGGQPTTDQQAAQDFRNQVPVVPGTGQPATRPGTPLRTLPLPGGAAPGGTTVPGGAVPQGTRQVDPLSVDTITKGVASPTLAKKLEQAEQDMKQGKFADAIEKYSLAEQAAPNDPLIALGRANAELGASNYRTAESRLRQAFGTQPALLMGKYDLRGFLGEGRLDAIKKDLAELSKKEQQETMAPFLLAYIAYNTGDAAEATTQLKEVARREGTPDPVVKAMLQRWAPANEEKKTNEENK